MKRQRGKQNTDAKAEQRWTSEAARLLMEEANIPVAVSLLAQSALNEPVFAAAIKAGDSMRLALIAALTNARSAEMGSEMVAVARQELQNALSLGEVHSISAKKALRFLACGASTGIVAPVSICALLLQLMGQANPASVQTANPRGDAYIYLALSALPWCASTLHTKTPLEFDELLSKVQTYITSRKTVAESISQIKTMLRIYKNEKGIDKLDSLWTQLGNLKELNWQVGILGNPYDGYSDLEMQTVQHSIPPLVIPSTVTVVKFDYQPHFRIFDDSIINGPLSVSNSPSVESIDRFIVSDGIADTVHTFSLNHKECAKTLLENDRLYNKAYMAEKGYAIHDAIVEGIFAQLLTFPVVLERTIYYPTLLMDLCRLSLDRIPSSFARCIKMIYSRLDHMGGMDMHAITRVSEFFSQHLSNFGFGWRWSDWESVLLLDHSNEKFVFVRETLERCVRLSYYDRIKNSLPESFLQHGDIFTLHPPGPVFQYDAVKCKDLVLVKHAAEVNQLIQTRSDESNIQQVIDAIQSHMVMIDEAAEAVSTSYRIIIQCVLLQGSKSFSHILNVFEKYVKLLQSLNETPQSRLETVSNVCEFWKNNTQFIEIILDKMVNYRIIDARAILVYFISVRDEVDFSRFYQTNIIKNTVVKVNLKVQQVEAKLELKNEIVSGQMDESSDATVKSLQSALDVAVREKKEALILVFQKFVEMLAEKKHAIGGSEMMSDGENDDVNEGVRWFRHAFSAFRFVGKTFQADMDKLKFTLDAVIFHDEVELSVLTTWHQLKAMYQMHRT